MSPVNSEQATCCTLFRSGVILFAWLRPPESHHSTVGYHDPACHRIENPNRFSVGCIAIQARQGLIVAWVKRAASVGKIDIVLGQQRFVNRRVPPVPG